jgi:hypothetical protein
VVNIALTEAAVALIRDVTRDSQFEYPALSVGRTPGATDLIRRPNGEAEWRIVDDALWYVHIVGQSDPPSPTELTPFAQLPGLVLAADTATSALVGTLTIDVWNGSLAVTSIAT